MAESVDVARLVSIYEARTTQFERALNKLDARSRRTTKRMSAGFRKVDAAIAASSANMGRYASFVGVALASRNVINYADAWTEAGNKIAAASQVAGRQARSLSALNEIAKDTRSTFRDTVDLYAKLLRSTKDVAKSEAQVAAVTATVNKAFKAGGASIQEQIAGVRQLGQALGSGFLQGDELRSIRENAPLIAAALAKEFNTTIGGLKKLGSEGEITSARVFQALVNSQSDIERTFSTTNATISDSFTQLKNSMIEVVGSSETVKAGADLLSRSMTQASDVIRLFAQFTAGPASLSTDKLKDRIKALRIEVERLKDAGQNATVDIARLAADEAELVKRIQQARAGGNGRNPGSPQAGFSLNAPTPRAKPAEEKLAAFSLAQVEAREKATRRALELRQQQNKSIDETIERLQLELSLVGQSNAQREIATTLAGLELTNGDKRIEQIKSLITNIDAQKEAIKRAEDAQSKAADAAARARDITMEMFDTISNGSKNSTRDMIQLVAQFVRLSQLAGSGGGGIAGGLSGGLDGLIQGFAGGAITR